MKYLYALLLVIGIISCSPESSEKLKSNNQLNILFEEIDIYSNSSQDSLYRGMHPIGEWQSSSLDTQQQRAKDVSSFIERLNAIEDNALSKQEKISKKVMLIQLRNQVAQVEYKMNLIPFNAEGGFYNRMAYVLPRLPFESTEDYQKYLTWLPQYNKQLLEHISILNQGIEEGIIAPKIIVNNTLNLLKPWVTDTITASAFHKPFAELPSFINETDKQDILNKAESVLTEIQQTYSDINNLFSGEYLKAAKEVPGISEVPGGRDYYTNRVQHYSTLNLSADSVHQLGLDEVKRIRIAMDSIIQELQFEGSFADFLEFLRTDPQFYPKDAQELLNYASWLSKKAEGQLPKLFKRLYSLPFTVEPVPDNIAPTYTTGRYVGGSWETKRAGIYWVNTYNLPSRTLYTLPSLTLHEAVPGHHLQNAIAAELKDLPKFRRSYYISAFGEGWGLYSEYLGEEMGMYATPYELFGRYTYEMWRACRLVVDTGIHFKGWTRNQALDYMASNTALSIHEVTTEIDRYIGWPGQALSYKIGEIKIKALRKEAQETLEDKFDLREFHDVILRNGSIPLNVLEEEVKDYIKEELAKTQE